MYVQFMRKSNQSELTFNSDNAVLLFSGNLHYLLNKITAIPCTIAFSP
jgi:hypothetical protein